MKYETALSGRTKMTTATSHNGHDPHIRTVVYREGEVYVAQCLEYDISTQAADIETLLERLDLTIDAECAMCADMGAAPFEGIPPAPNYFHSLWDKRSVTLKHLNTPVHQHLSVEIALAKAA